MYGLALGRIPEIVAAVKRAHRRAKPGETLYVTPGELAVRFGGPSPTQTGFVLSTYRGRMENEFAAVGLTVEYLMRVPNGQPGRRVLAISRRP